MVETEEEAVVLANAEAEDFGQCFEPDDSGESVGFARGEAGDDREGMAGGGGREEVEGLVKAARVFRQAERLGGEGFGGRR